jgi:hypothetical protein
VRLDLVSRGWFDKLHGAAPSMKDCLSETLTAAEDKAAARLRSRLKRSRPGVISVMALLPTRHCDVTGRAHRNISVQPLQSGLGYRALT